MSKEQFHDKIPKIWSKKSSEVFIFSPNFQPLNLVSMCKNYLKKHFLAKYSKYNDNLSQIIKIMLKTVSDKGHFS
jgi:hypothetical protein